MFLARRDICNRTAAARANRRNQTAELNCPASFVTNFVMPDKPGGKMLSHFPPEADVQGDRAAATVINEPSRISAI